MALLLPGNEWPRLVGLWDMPQGPAGGVAAGDVVGLVKRLGPVKLAVLEAVGASPGAGTGSSFAFGRAYGIVEAALYAAGITPRMVPPAVWKASYGLPGGPAGKVAARALARQLLGDQAGTWFDHVKDDGRAEAVLLAWWGLRHGMGLRT